MRTHRVRDCRSVQRSLLSSNSPRMDQQLVNDFVAVLLRTRVKELQDDCEKLHGRVDELECIRERKTNEIARLRQTIKNEQHLKQSALSKLAQIEIAGPSASVVSTADHWLTTAANFADSEKVAESGVSSACSSGAGNAASGSGGTVDRDFQRRLLELELQLVSKERENLTKHKVIIDHFESVLQAKQQKIDGKEEEIRRMRAELAQKQSTIDRLRLEHGFTARIRQSPSSSAVSTMLSKGTST